MKRTLLVAVAAVALAAPAHAAFVCNITDTKGDDLTYSFVKNTYNADGSFGGTMVEDGFSRNGRVTVSPVGARPIWTVTANAAGGYNLHSREAPGWYISVANGSVGLFHNSVFKGSGSCRLTNGVTAANVGDQGYSN
jgi:hypothetical protein